MLYTIQSVLSVASLCHFSYAYGFKYLNRIYVTLVPLGGGGYWVWAGEVGGWAQHGHWGPAGPARPGAGAAHRGREPAAPWQAAGGPRHTDTAAWAGGWGWLVDAVYYALRKISGEHIVAALSVRPSVCTSHSFPAHNFVIWSQIWKLFYRNDHYVETMCPAQHLGPYLEGKGHSET